MKNIVLIGMPGAGKSTIGVMLAKHLSKDFIDTDILIQNRYKVTLQRLMDMYGYQKLRNIEERVILSIDTRRMAVIATGGSAVYSNKAMLHLRHNGVIIYLKLNKQDLIKRIDNFETRGITKPADMTFNELFEERSRLYKKYGEVVIKCKNKTPEDIISEIVSKIDRCTGPSQLSA